ncbi:MAG: PD40 domain-containing protein [Elusimicrobia bacterium]|nr:PD40 domain-containing protein [Elusimicrobiota bacterium]
MLLCLLTVSPVQAQEENKVIVKKFNWRIYATEHFDIHYYEDSAAWLPYAAGALEKAYKKESADLNPALEKRFPFFLYASINDMQQSNIADVSDGVGGLTEPFKDRFMVWSDGSRGWLTDVITHEFAHEVQFSVLIDGFWKSARILKTFVYPLWMMEGIAEYETGASDLPLEKMYVRDAALSGRLLRLDRLNQFAHLKPHQTTLAYKTGAQAIRFLAAQYGKDKPARMLELFKTRYDVSSVLAPLIGLEISAFDKKFREYAELEYLAEAKDSELSEPARYGERLTAEKENIPEFNLSPQLSPDGARLAYISTKEGHPPVIALKDLKTGREELMTAREAGAENISYARFSKPWKSLSFSGDGRRLAFSGQKNHREYIYLYEPAKGKFSRLEIPGFMEARQPVFSGDSSRLMFVGMKRGLNDIYAFNLTPEILKGKTVPPEALSRLTDDADDEASPAWAPDGAGAAYSCEVQSSSGPRRALCYSAFGSKKETLVSMDGNIYDPVFSPDGKKILFVSDVEDRFELYELDLAASRVSRLTRTVGGNFTPAYSPDGRQLLFSSFRNGSMNVYAGLPENFRYEPYKSPVTSHQSPATSHQSPAAEAQESGAQAFSASTGAFAAAGTYKPYKFKASTDLFFPAFMFSSPGGLFWMNYWQASDMLGNNNLALYVNYNSGSEFLSGQLNYSYARYRMPLIFQAAGLVSNNNYNELYLKYDKRYLKNTAGAAYPFDRYNRLEAYFIHKNEINIYRDIALTERYQTRALQTSYVRDTVSGLYLTAVRGSRTELTYIKAADLLGGDQKYDVYMFQRLQYAPMSKRSAFVDRFLAGESAGRDRRTFGFGGLGGVRGFSSSSDLNSHSRVLMNNLELRAPLFKDLNYYMWFMFPDFYFKAIYAKVFFDSAYGWDRGADLDAFRASDIKSSVGAGINIHTFILQAFPLVLSFDYAVRLRDGGKIFYFYLGPMF